MICTRAARLLPCALLLVAAAGVSQAAPRPLPAPPEVGASSYILYDYATQRALVSQDAHERVEPASITKLMTAYVVFSELENGRIALQDRVQVSRKAWKAPGSRMYIRVGTRVGLDDLLKGLIVSAGNDAAVALAEHVGGSESVFVKLMNQTAQRLHMDGTHYVNASGLPDAEHYTTARDTALLLRALIHDFPERYRRYYSMREYTYNGIRQFNRNRLVVRERVDGGQTGYTDSAGYCLATSASEHGMRLIAVVMGAKSEDSRLEANEALLSYGFRFYRTRKLYDAGEAVTERRVWQGAAEEIELGLRSPLLVTVPRARAGDLDTEIEVEAELLAPLRRGDRAGSLSVSLGEQVLAERPLVALESVPQGSLWQRASDYVYRLILESAGRL